MSTYSMLLALVSLAGSLHLMLKPLAPVYLQLCLRLRLGNSLRSPLNQPNRLKPRNLSSPTLNNQLAPLLMLLVRSLAARLCHSLACSRWWPRIWRLR